MSETDTTCPYVSIFLIKWGPDGHLELELSVGIRCEIANYQMPFYVRSDLMFIGRLGQLQPRCHLSTNNNPRKLSLRVKFWRSILVSIFDSALKFKRRCCVGDCNLQSSYYCVTCSDVNNDRRIVSVCNPHNKPHSMCFNAHIALNLNA